VRERKLIHGAAEEFKYLKDNCKKVF
jgi:hypothetical protein